MQTDESLVEMYKHLVVYVLETAMNKTEIGVCLLDFVRQVFGKQEVVLESNTQIFFLGNLVEVHPALP